MRFIFSQTVKHSSGLSDVLNVSSFSLPKISGWGLYWSLHTEFSALYASHLKPKISSAVTPIPTQVDGQRQHLQ